jgi:hypothetical protein
MHPVRPLLLAGLACGAVAGLAGFAHAGAPGFKTMTVQLPGGGIEQIEYTGNIAPQVILSPAATDPFAALEQISAQMDEQAAAMIDAVNAMAAGALAPPGGMVPASISAMTGGAGGMCVQSLEITALGNGQPPQVVSRASGDCGGHPTLGAPAGAVPAALPAAPVPVQQPHLIRVRYLVPKAASTPSQT